MCDFIFNKFRLQVFSGCSMQLFRIFSPDQCPSNGFPNYYSNHGCSHRSFHWRTSNNYTAYHCTIDNWITNCRAVNNWVTHPSTFNRSTTYSRTIDDWITNGRAINNWIANDSAQNDWTTYNWTIEDWITNGRHINHWTTYGRTNDDRTNDDWIANNGAINNETANLAEWTTYNWAVGD
jgi:hypothetical protein